MYVRAVSKILVERPVDWTFLGKYLSRLVFVLVVDGLCASWGVKVPQVSISETCCHFYFIFYSLCCLMLPTLPGLCICSPASLCVFLPFFYSCSIPTLRQSCVQKLLNAVQVL